MTHGMNFSIHVFCSFPLQDIRDIKEHLASVHLIETVRLHPWKVAIMKQKRRTMLWKIVPLSLMRTPTAERRKRARTRTPSCEITDLQITDFGLWTSTAWLNCEHTLHSAGRRCLSQNGQKLTSEGETMTFSLYCISQILEPPCLNLFIHNYLKPHSVMNSAVPMLFN